MTKKSPAPRFAHWALLALLCVFSATEILAQARFDRDISFGNAGKSIVLFDAGGPNNDFPVKILQRSDGSIDTVSTADASATTNSLGLKRVAANGTLGISRLVSPIPAITSIFDAVLGPDGKLYVLAAANSTSYRIFAFNSDYTDVAGFPVSVPVGPFTGMRLAINPAGSKIVVVGSVTGDSSFVRGHTAATGALVDSCGLGIRQTDVIATPSGWWIAGLSASQFRLFRKPADPCGASLANISETTCLSASSVGPKDLISTRSGGQLYALGSDFIPFAGTALDLAHVMHVGAEESATSVNNARCNIASNEWGIVLSSFNATPTRLVITTRERKSISGFDTHVRSQVLLKSNLSTDQILFPFSGVFGVTRDGDRERVSYADSAFNDVASVDTNGLSESALFGMSHRQASVVADRDGILTRQSLLPPVIANGFE